MSLSTSKYGYVVDPLFAITDETGKTISNGYIRVFYAGTSTPALTYANYDGTLNEERIQFDNSCRCATLVIASNDYLYKVCVYDNKHSQDNPIFTLDYVPVAFNTAQFIEDAVNEWLVEHPGATTTVNYTITNRIYNTVSEMVADTTIEVGTKCKTLGYYSVNDGGGAQYEIVLESSGTGHRVAVSNNLYALLIENGRAVINQYGCRNGDDISAVLQGIINRAANEGLYHIDAYDLNCKVLTPITTTAINAYKAIPFTIDFHGSKLVGEDNVFIDGHDAALTCLNVQNVFLEGFSKCFYYNLFVSNSTLRNIQFKNCSCFIDAEDCYTMILENIQCFNDSDFVSTTTEKVAYLFRRRSNASRLVNCTTGAGYDANVYITESQDMSFQHCIINNVVLYYTNSVKFDSCYFEKSDPSVVGVRFHGQNDNVTFTNCWCNIHAVMAHGYKGDGGFARNITFESSNTLYENNAIDGTRIFNESSINDYGRIYFPSVNVDSVTSQEETSTLMTYHNIGEHMIIDRTGFKRDANGRIYELAMVPNPRMTTRGNFRDHGSNVLDAELENVSNTIVITTKLKYTKSQLIFVRFEWVDGVGSYSRVGFVMDETFNEIGAAGRGQVAVSHDANNNVVITLTGEGTGQQYPQFLYFNLLA